jgi:NADH:ubiquinone oxidoreductase subunit E
LPVQVYVATSMLDYRAFNSSPTLQYSLRRCHGLSCPMVDGRTATARAVHEEMGDGGEAAKPNSGSSVVSLAPATRFVCAWEF